MAAVREAMQMAVFYRPGGIPPMPPGIAVSLNDRCFNLLLNDDCPEIAEYVRLHFAPRLQRRVTRTPPRTLRQRLDEATTTARQPSLAAGTAAGALTANLMTILAGATDPTRDFGFASMQDAFEQLCALHPHAMDALLPIVLPILSTAEQKTLRITARNFDAPERDLPRHRDRG